MSYEQDKGLCQDSFVFMFVVFSNIYFYTLFIMQVTLDFLVGALILITALSLSIAILPLNTEPVHSTPVENPTTIRIIENRVISNKPLRIWIVSFNSSGGYKIIESTTPTNLPDHYFTVVFTGRKIIYIGKPPTHINGYICRKGLLKKEPHPPYIKVSYGIISKS